MSNSSTTEPILSTEILKIPIQFTKLKELDCLLSYDDAVKMTNTAAAHVLIWSKSDNKSSANVMMHLRFDGKFGFPGGLVDPGEDAVVALNRELIEEIGWDVSNTNVTWKDYICSMFEKSTNYILHFFVVELAIEEYKSLEEKCLRAVEYGREVLGTIRVPLYTRKDNYGGFPAFLDNVFISKAKYQLILGLWHGGILTEREIMEAFSKSTVTSGSS